MNIGDSTGKIWRIITIDRTSPMELNITEIPLVPLSKDTHTFSLSCLSCSLLSYQIKSKSSGI